MPARWPCWPASRNASPPPASSSTSPRLTPRRPVVPRPAVPRRPALTQVNAALGQVNVDRAALDLDRVGAQVDQHRGAERLPAGVVEPAVVLGALDDAALDQAVAQQRLLVGA